MKKLIFILSISILLFSSCWIEPKIGDYKQDGDICYYDNYETMRSLVLPEINSTFKDWHWSDKEFDEKYEKYLGNIDLDPDLFNTLKDSGYTYLSKKGVSNYKLYYNAENSKKPIKNNYILIINTDGNAVVFFEL